MDKDRSSSRRLGGRSSDRDDRTSRHSRRGDRSSSRRRRYASDEDDDSDGFNRRDSRSSGRRRHRESSRGSSRRAHSDRRSGHEEERRDGRPEPPAAAPQPQESSLAGYLGYTNDDNPFGDPNLTKQFVWKKKPQAAAPKHSPQDQDAGSERDGAVSAHDGSTVALSREGAIIRELKAVEERRKVREAEEAERERLRAEEDRLRESELHGDYDVAEKEFEKTQHRRRTLIRVREGRERPSDVLVKNLLLLQAGRRAIQGSSMVVDGPKAAASSAADEEAWSLMLDPAVDFELAEPYSLLVGLPSMELRALQRELQTMREMGPDVDGSSSAEDVAAAVEAARAGAVMGGEHEAVRAARAVAEAAVAAKAAQYSRYFGCLLVVTADALHRAEAEEAEALDSVGIGGLSSAVETDVIRMLGWRDSVGLAAMEPAIRARARASAGVGSARGGGDGAAGHGVGYWEGVLRALAVLRARSELRDAHKAALHQRLEHLRAARAQAPTIEAKQTPSGPAASAMAVEAAAVEAAAASAVVSTPSKPAALKRAASPPRLRGDAAEAACKTAVTDEADVVTLTEMVRLLAVDRRSAAERAEARAATLATAATSTPASASASAVAVAVAGGGKLTVEQAIERGLLRDSESTLAEAAEVFTDGGAGAVPGAIDSSMLSAEELAAFGDKYRPRRPRYISRVRSGYHWNSHNKAYYDYDNPPPKMVQGYKFNVFYPDLLDPSTTPRYTMEAADTPAFCILRFHGGPPYEDIAFKIVNREWLTGKKSGYICSFERGVFKLFFNLKTHLYRR